MMLITPAPQIHHPQAATHLIWPVILCLLPAGIWGTAVFGLRALAVVFTAVAVSLLTEGVFNLLYRRFTLFDGSALLTGLLLGYSLPPGVPFYIPAAGAVFALAVVKWTFGGLGGNWMNPALAGRVFVFFSWPGPMTVWQLPRTWGTDALTGATPLGTLRDALEGFQGRAAHSMEMLNSAGMIHTSWDAQASGWLNEHLFNPLGTHLPAGYVDLFTGNVPGAVGEVSALLLLAGTVYLVARDILAWEIPLSYLGAFSLLVWLFGGLRLGQGLGEGDVLFHLLAGGLLLGVFFMATDTVTSPMTGWGRIIFGTGAGFLTFLLRFYGSAPEGVALAIILMNSLVPLIDRYTRPQRKARRGFSEEGTV